MNTSTGGGFGNLPAFGLPAKANLFTINGNDYNDPFLNLNNSGASNLLLGSNEVQEVAVVSNGYTGQYGRQAGAQVDYTTKSGGNAFHGDAVYYWNGSALNANDPFLNAGGQPRPFENNNQWAVSLGGPIKKDKAFFFDNTEGLRYTDKIYGRVKFDRGNQPTYSDPMNPAFNIQSNQPQNEGQLNYTHVFSPRVVNNFVGSVLHYSALFQSPNLSSALSTFPFILSTTDTSLTPLGSGSGSDPQFALFPQGRNVTQWQLVDDLSVERGKHTFKMGVNFRRHDVTDFTAN